ncbi:MAG TPA: restriction endonuclease [Candidatus Limnocylindrales bacterium]
MTRAEQVQQFLDDFVFLDCRLGDHPKVESVVFQVVGDHLVSDANCMVAQTNVGRFSIPMTASVAGLAVQNRRVYIISDEPDLSYGLAYDLVPKSELIVPIVAGDDAIGVLAFESVDPNAFDETHLGRAQLLAAVIAYLSSSAGTRGAQSEKLGRALASVRQELGLTQEEVADRIETSRIALSRWESGAQPPSYGPLCLWCRALGLLQSKGHALVTSVDVSHELLSLLRQDPELLHRLPPEGFENFVGERLERMGFDVQQTGSTYLRDGGIDFVAIPKVRTVATYLMAVQVKHHAEGIKTGRTPVDRLLSWKDGPFRFGLLVTNTGFTRDALWTAMQQPSKGFLRLRDFTDLKRWLEGNFWSPEEWRELPSQVEVAPGVMIDIPRGELRNWHDVWPLSDSRQGQIRRSEE